MGVESSKATPKSHKSSQEFDLTANNSIATLELDPPINLLGYGEIHLIHSQNTPQKVRYAIKTATFSTEQEFSSYLSQAKSRHQYLSAKSIAKPLLIKSEINQQLCSNFYKVHSVYEFHQTSMLDHIKLRKNQNQIDNKQLQNCSPFSENEIYQFLDSVISALLSFQASNVPHFDIRPSTIFVSNKGDYFLTDINFLYHKQNTPIKELFLFQGSINDSHKLYLPPEKICQLRLKDISSLTSLIDWQKGDLFSLGLIALEMKISSSEFAEEIYDFNRFEIRQSTLVNFLESIKPTSSSHLYFLISSMLNFNKNKRPSFQQLSKQITLKLSTSSSPVQNNSILKSLVPEQSIQKQGILSQKQLFNPNQIDNCPDNSENISQQRQHNCDKTNNKQFGKVLKEMTHTQIKHQTHNKDVGNKFQSGTIIQTDEKENSQYEMNKPQSNKMQQKQQLKDRRVLITELNELNQNIQLTLEKNQKLQLKYRKDYKENVIACADAELKNAFHKIQLNSLPISIQSQEDERKYNQRNKDLPSLSKNSKEPMIPLRKARQSTYKQTQEIFQNKSENSLIKDKINYKIPTNTSQQELENIFSSITLQLSSNNESDESNKAKLRGKDHQKCEEVESSCSTQQIESYIKTSIDDFRKINHTEFKQNSRPEFEQSFISSDDCQRQRECNDAEIAENQKNVNKVFNLKSIDKASLYGLYLKDYQSLLRQATEVTNFHTENY